VVVASLDHMQICTSLQTDIHDSTPPCQIRYLTVLNNQLCNSALTVLVGWQEGHPACRNLVVGCWHGYLSGTRCRFAYLVPDWVWYQLTQV